jgi:Flp pilus assembly pilin Flp
MSSFFRRLAASESGVTALEYAFVVGLISVACISSLTTIGQWLQNTLIAAMSAIT